MQKKKGRVWKEKSAYRSTGLPPDRAPTDLRQGSVERSVQSLRAAHFFFFWSLLCEDGRDPLPTNERSSFRKLLRTFATAP